MTAPKPGAKYRKPRCQYEEHEWDDPESGQSYCVVCGVDERDADDIRTLEAEVKQLKDEKRALIEALEALPKLAALRHSIESELLSDARGKEEGR